jgi:hypothetical protein
MKILLITIRLFVVCAIGINAALGQSPTSEPQLIKPIASITSKKILFSQFFDISKNPELNNILKKYQENTFKYGYSPNGEALGQWVEPVPGTKVTLLLLGYGEDKSGVVNCFITPLYGRGKIRIQIGVYGFTSSVRLDQWVNTADGWVLRDSI